MKTLFLIRHAKSSWDNLDLADIDRPLNDRGKRDAVRMGKRLKEKGIHPELLITSPAKRAHSTCKRIAEALGCSLTQIIKEHTLYHAAPEQILTVLHTLKNNMDTVFAFGHNPGITDFANLANANQSRIIDNVPTCGVVAFQFATSDWKEVGFKKGKLLFYDYPKSRLDFKWD